MIRMSRKELIRHETIVRVIENQWTQQKASQELGLSIRQIKRLCKRYKTEGVLGLAHKNRGRISFRKVREDQRQEIIKIIQDRYPDFGPTLISEMLSKEKGKEFSREWIRKLLIETGLWVPKHLKRLKSHGRRNRRAREGELIQMDGSYADWFEGRAEKCCLLVIVDDATSKLQELCFVDHETTEGYFEMLERYIKARGLPMALYTDRHSVFKVTRKGGEYTRQSQFGRAMKELGIELIHARSPQAKGRVERANGVLQDRLIKMMRLRGISGKEEGNAFLEEFRLDYNSKFGRKPLDTKDGHREVKMDIEKALSVKEERKVSKNLTIQYGNKIYGLKVKGRNARLPGKVIKVRFRKGIVHLEQGDTEFEYTTYEEVPYVREAMDRKEITAFLDRKKPITAITRHRKKIASIKF
jgi:transposase